VDPILAGTLAAVTVAYAGYELFLRRRIQAGRAERTLRRLAEEPEAPVKAEAPRESLAFKFQAAGLNVPPEKAKATLYAVSLALGLAIFGAALALGLPFVLALALGCLSALYPSRYLEGKVKAMGKQIDRELPVALTRIASMIKTTPEVAEVLLSVADTLEAEGGRSPLAAEFRRTARDLRQRGEKALDGMEKRAAQLSPSLATVAFQLKRYREKGGAAFAEAFVESAENLQAIIGGRNRAEARASEIMSAVRYIPLALFATLLFFLKGDPSMRRTLQMPAVQAALAGAMTWMALGYWFMKGMVEEVG